MSQERRSFARLYVGVEANYTQKDLDASGRTVLVQDISLSGVRFISNEILPENTELKFVLNIADLKNPFSAKGKVVWQKKFSDSFYDTGIDFISLDQATKEDLSVYINKSLGRVKENREFVRSNLSTMIAYKITDNPDIEEKRCISVDISSSGLKVFAKESLIAETNLEISFSLPDDPEIIFAQGRVMWSKAGEEKFSEIGIEFISIEEKFIAKINRYVKGTLGIEW
ncbi:MAG: PilZ domain-containing protein [Candidatus Omnitrophica bacterium]|nr:PilZ domain-containing protein [Candidatus Omnitrophota bacterium]